MDSKAGRVDDEAFSGILDEDILGSDSTHVSPAMRNRKDSFNGAAAPFTSPHGAWEGLQLGAGHATAFDVPTGTDHASLHRSQALPADSATAAAMHFHPQSCWPAAHDASGSCTPTDGFVSMPPDYEHNVPAIAPVYRQPTASIVQGNVFDNFQVDTRHGMPAGTGFAVSPHSAQDWLSASAADRLDSRPLPAGATSSPFATSTHILRRDGIRKKNARFEIPAERNLRTIDHLINQTSDEQEIKELKQQKRLLRNRQAALDSRQRKKQHTERLEEEKKHYTTVISDLEDALGDLKVQEAEWIRQRNEWIAAQQQYQQYIDAMVMEKEELVRCHTIETGELRKKNAILMEQLQRAESTTMSTAPSSTGYSADFSEFEHLTMNSSPWDNFSMTHDFTVDADQREDAASMMNTKFDARTARPDDKAATSGLLLMLLLCGAWVASRGSAASGNLLPSLPEDVKVASATVLDDLYKDSGIQLQAPLPSVFAIPPLDAVNLAPSAHGIAISTSHVPAVTSSLLGTAHHRLVTPSERQSQEQAFSLTSDQYNSLSTSQYWSQQPSTEVHSHRSLGEALAAVRIASDEPAAETYTKSLMKDRVPTQILKDFARMVAASSVGGKWKRESAE